METTIANERKEFKNQLKSLNNAITRSYIWVVASMDVGFFGNFIISMTKTLTHNPQVAHTAIEIRPFLLIAVAIPIIIKSSDLSSLKRTKESVRELLRTA